MKRVVRRWFREIKVCSDWFKCSGCGRLARIRTPGDTYTCIECGSKMYRQ